MKENHVLWRGGGVIIFPRETRVCARVRSGRWCKRRRAREGWYGWWCRGRRRRRRRRRQRRRRRRASTITSAGRRGSQYKTVRVAVQTSRHRRDRSPRNSARVQCPSSGIVVVSQIVNNNNNTDVININSFIINRRTRVIGTPPTPAADGKLCVFNRVLSNVSPRTDIKLRLKCPTRTALSSVDGFIREAVMRTEDALQSLVVVADRRHGPRPSCWIIIIESAAADFFLLRHTVRCHATVT